MSYIFEELTEKNAQEWDDFLLQQPYQNPFQSGKLFTILQETEGLDPFGIVARGSEKNDIVGGVVSYNICETSGLTKVLLTRNTINGGPIVDTNHPELIQILISKITSHKKAVGVYTDLWNMTQKQSDQSQNLSKSSYVGHLNYLVSLEGGEEVVQSNMQRRLRRTIRKNQKKLMIKQVTTKEDFDLLYGCFKSTYKRVHVPLLKKHIFKKVFDAQYGIWLLAMYEDEVAAARVILPFGKELYDWFAGDIPKHAKLNANASLVWWVLEYGIKNNFEWFNFGGAGKPNKPYGPREFKRKFGGELVNYGRAKIVHKQLLNLGLQTIITVKNKLLG